MMSWQQKAFILALIALVTVSFLYGIVLLGDWSVKRDCQHYSLVYQVETQLVSGQCWADVGGKLYPVAFRWPEDK